MSINPAERTYGYYLPTINYMGVGCHKELPKTINQLGASKPLVVCDSGPVSDMAKEIINWLKADHGITCALYDKAVPNPTDTNVHDGVGFYQSESCDAIITIGGGSSHDCGKGIGIVVSNGGKIHDYEGVDLATRDLPPLIAVNTTAGTASEITRFTIITDTARHVKMAIIDWRVTPKVAINDPVLMKGMPPFLTACTGMDALTHAIEAYVSTAATPATDCAALKAIELVSEYLRPAVANGDDMEARDKMAYAEFLAGVAFNNASLGYVHAMAHQLGGKYNLPHGMCNAILLPHVESFNLIACLDKFADIAVAMGEDIGDLSVRDAAEVAIDAVITLSEDVGIPAGLADVNVKEEDFQEMAENAMRDACGLTNPRVPRIEDVIGIFQSAM